MDRHSFDAYPDPSPSFTHVGKLESMIFIHSSVSLHCFIFLVSIKDVINFNVLDSILTFSGEKFSLALHLVEMDKGPNSENGKRMPIRPVPDPQRAYNLTFPYYLIPSNGHISTPFFQKTVFFSKIFFGKPPLKFLEVCLNSE